MADNYRAQQAEGLITMASLRERLDEVGEEREQLERRLAVLADAERRVAELEELPSLVESYLRDLPELVDGWARYPVRDYETVPAERTPENPHGIYRATPDTIRWLTDEEVAERKTERDRVRGERYRRLYALLGLRAAVHADGTVEVEVGATDKRGVMPCNVASSPSIICTQT